MLRLVDAMYRTGRRADAQNTLALFMSQNPQDVPARRLAGALADRGKATGARRSSRSNRCAPPSATAMPICSPNSRSPTPRSGDAQRGRIYGAAAYRLALLNPAVVDAYGWACRAAGDKGAARQLLTKAASLAPADPSIRAHLVAVTSG